MGVAIINVVDDAAQTSREFRCDIKLLLAHMHLLTADLGDVPGQDVHITVKCDIPTFAWLMAYVKADSRGQQPVISLSNCLQLLLASHYLQMPGVVRVSVSYIAANLLDLAHAAAQQLCNMGKGLLAKLAKAVPEETLEALHHRCHTTPSSQQQQQQKHTRSASSARTPLAANQHAHNMAKGCHGATTTTTTDASGSGGNNCSSSTHSHTCALVEKLYKHKLRALLRQHDSTMLRCRACGVLFASSGHSRLQCPCGGMPPNKQFKLPLHDPDPSWDFQDFLLQCKHGKLHRQQPHQQQALQQQVQPHGDDNLQPQQQQQQDSMAWCQLYWFVWGHVMVLWCQRCCCHFPARQLHDCRYHPLPAVFESDVALGRYPCCGAAAWQPCAQSAAGGGGSAGAGGSTNAAAAGSSSATAADSSAAAAGRTACSQAAAGTAASGPCCRRDHLPYVADTAFLEHRAAKMQAAAARGPTGRSAGASAGGSRSAHSSAVPVGAARAVELLQQFDYLITAADSSDELQHQQQQHERVIGNTQQQQQQQHSQQTRLPLLVKLVTAGSRCKTAAASSSQACTADSSLLTPAAPCLAAAEGTTAGNSDSSGSRGPDRARSASPLPPIASPPQQLETSAGWLRPQLQSAVQQQQQQQQSCTTQEFSLRAAAEAALGSAAAAAAGGAVAAGRGSAQLQQVSLLGARAAVNRQLGESYDAVQGASSQQHGEEDCSDDASDDGSTGSSSRSRSTSRGSAHGSGSSGASLDSATTTSSGSGTGSRAVQVHQVCSNLEGSSTNAAHAATAAAAAGPDANSSSAEEDWEDEGLSLEGAKGAAPLSNMLGAVRAAAEARAKGLLGSAQGDRGGLGFSSGSVAAGRACVLGTHASAAPLAETFSVGGKKVLSQAGRATRPGSRAAAVRPGTTGSSSSIRGQAARAAVFKRQGAAAGAGEEGQGAGLPSIGAAFNRTLLLELVQQDDAHRMGVLMRQLDALRLQPPPDDDAVDCKQHHQQQQQQQPTAAGAPTAAAQQEVNVMRAVNAVVFKAQPHKLRC